MTIKTITEMIEASSEYLCGNIKYEIRDGMIAIYNCESFRGVFYNPDIAARFISTGIAFYCVWENDRVELHIHLKN